MNQQVGVPPAPLITILGPTGSGKSAAGLAVARHWPAEIVNCDSLQVFRYFSIGTAKLAAEQREGVPHHMIDLVDPAETFTAGDYARRTRPILLSIAAAGKLPVVAGGTGFYLRALLDGLFEGPSRDDTLRERLLWRETRRQGSLHRLLRRLDQVSAERIHGHDTRKLIRALEVRILAGRPLSVLHAAGRNRLHGFRTLKIVLDPPRDQLNEELDRRVVAMFETGLLDEVRSILGRGVPETAKPFESLGYRQALDVLRERISLGEAIESTQLETRRYAKRQWTWFRKEPDAVWIAGFGSASETQTRLLNCVRTFLREPS